MRDCRSGQEWDSRTLDDLQWWVVRVSCRGCRHSRLVYPIDLKAYIGPRERWTVAIPRLRCSVCGERKAIADAQPLPR